MEINNRFLYTGAIGREEQVEDRINIFLECLGSLVLVIGIEKYYTLTTTLWNILVLPLLSICKVVVLIKNIPDIYGIKFPVSTLDNTNASSSNVSKALYRC